MKKILVFAAVLAATMVGRVNADLISEFTPNPEGTDPATTQLEVWGTAGAAFSFTFLTIEAEGGGTGTIDFAHSFAGNFDANGLFVTTMNDFENPAFTAFLVRGFNGTAGTDLDTNNDGTFDVTPWDSIADSLNVPDGASIGSGDTFYGVNSLVAPTSPAGVDDEPISVFRSGSTGDWYGIYETPDGSTTYQVYDANGNQVDSSLFDIDPTTNTSTFGSINPTFAPVPEPSALLLVGSVLGAGFLRRRR